MTKSLLYVLKKFTGEGKNYSPFSPGLLKNSGCGRHELA
jgi:hypothetical protein